MFDGRGVTPTVTPVITPAATTPPSTPQNQSAYTGAITLRAASLFLPLSPLLPSHPAALTLASLCILEASFLFQALRVLLAHSGSEPPARYVSHPQLELLAPFQRLLRPPRPSSVRPMVRSSAGSGFDGRRVRRRRRELKLVRFIRALRFVAQTLTPPHPDPRRCAARRRSRASAEQQQQRGDTQDAAEQSASQSAATRSAGILADRFFTCPPGNLVIQVMRRRYDSYHRKSRPARQQWLKARPRGRRSEPSGLGSAGRLEEGLRRTGEARCYGADPGRGAAGW